MGFSSADPPSLMWVFAICWAILVVVLVVVISTFPIRVDSSLSVCASPTGWSLVSPSRIRLMTSWSRKPPLLVLSPFSWLSWVSSILGTPCRCFWSLSNRMGAFLVPNPNCSECLILWLKFVKYLQASMLHPVLYHASFMYSIKCGFPSAWIM